MTLCISSLLYVFLEAHSIDRQRQFLESHMGLRAIEIDANPSHHHGIVKYDAGNLIISVNRSPVRQFSPDSSDGLLISFSDQGTQTTDEFGHHYVIDAVPTQRDHHIDRLILAVNDLGHSIRFYGDILGLKTLNMDGDRARVDTTHLRIILQKRATAVDGRDLRFSGYLLVLYTPNIERAYADLSSAGVRFSGRRIAASAHGRTARFKDPTGHEFCLYEPSERAFGWPSGAKVRELVGGRR